LLLDQAVAGADATVVVERSPAGAILEAHLDLSILPRLDPLLVGRPVEQVPPLVERLCGVCPAAHHLAGMAALEALRGIGPIPDEARRLRRLLHYGSTLTMYATSFFALGRDEAPLLRRLGKAAMAAAGSPGHFPHTAVIGGVASHPVPDAVQTCLETAPAALAAASALFDWALAAANTQGAVQAGAADWAGRLSAADQQAETPGQLGAAASGRGGPADQGAVQTGAADWAGRLSAADQQAEPPGQLGAAASVRGDAAGGWGDGIGQGEAYRGADVALVDARGRLDPLGEFLRAVSPTGEVLVAGARASQWDALVAQARPGEVASRPYLQVGGAGGGHYRVGPVAQLRVAAPPTALAAQLRERWLARAGSATAARAVQAVHCVEAIIGLAGEVGRPGNAIKLDLSGALTGSAGGGGVGVGAGEAGGGVGVGWVDAARGLLVHRYRVDAAGAVDQALVLTPTAQNEHWLAELLVEALGAGRDKAALEDAIRVADPCLPCVAAPVGYMAVAVTVRGADGAPSGSRDGAREVSPGESQSASHDPSHNDFQRGEA
jgi:NAD-reducing hydrogenase large subunit